MFSTVNNSPQSVKSNKYIRIETFINNILIINDFPEVKYILIYREKCKNIFDIRIPLGYNVKVNGQ